MQEGRLVGYKGGLGDETRKVFCVRLSIKEKNCESLTNLRAIGGSGSDGENPRRNIIQYMHKVCNKEMAL